MGKGVLEVHLVDAKGLSGNDFLGALRSLACVLGCSSVEYSSSSGVLTLSCASRRRCAPAGKIDPYVIVQYRSQERKSSVARSQC